MPLLDVSLIQRVINRFILMAQLPGDIAVFVDYPTLMTAGFKFAGLNA
jgi:hypothetical protein